VNKLLGPVTKIVSGGQTGADRAALDWAISQGLPHGGWCPLGRRAEGGKIPAKYQLQETTSPGYAARTEQNVQDADGTVIFSVSPRLTGGTLLTYELAQRHRKPLLHLHLETTVPERRLLAFLHQHAIRVINVAGPRASQAPAVASFVANTLDRAHAEHIRARSKSEEHPRLPAPRCMG
jgi:hypothetical protein